MFGGSGKSNTDDKGMVRVAAPAESSDLSHNSANSAHGGLIGEQVSPNVSSAHTNVGVTQQAEIPVEKVLFQELMLQIQQLESQMLGMALSNANSSGDNAANKAPADLGIFELEKLMQTLELDQTEQAASPSSDNEPVSNTLPEIIPSKDWHPTISLEVRNHLVKKITYVIFPRCNDPNIMNDRRVQKVITCCHKIERDVYAMANSRDEYYHLIAQKIFSIQMELDEMSKKRLHAQLKSLMENGSTTSVPNSVVRHLLDVLKGPLSVEEQRELLQLIKGNPTLMAAVSRERQLVTARHFGGGSNVPTAVCQSPVSHNLEAARILSEPRQNCQRNRAALHQLLHLVKSPSSPEQQQQILQILRSNPQLMAAFIKQRQLLAARAYSRKNIASSSGQLRH